MSKNKRGRNSSKRALKTRRLTQIRAARQRNRRFIKRAGQGTAVLLAILGLFSSISTILGTFWPRLSVMHLPEDKPGSPLALQFQVANNGWVMPLGSLSYRFSYPTIYSSSPTQHKPPKPPPNLPPPPYFPIGTLRAGEQTTIQIFGFTALPKDEDVTVVLELEFRYRPLFSLWRTTEHIRMVSLPDRDGKTKWLPHPSGDLQDIRRGRAQIDYIPIPIDSLTPDHPGDREARFSLESGQRNPAAPQVNPHPNPSRSP
jgi:hypothetical protein